MDYRELLKKYMKCMLHYDGDTCMGSVDHSVYTNMLTNEERAEIHRIDREVSDE